MSARVASPQSLQTLLAPYGLPAPDVELTGLELDSRRIKPGDLFLACRSHDPSGASRHGLQHVGQALQRGAAAVAWEPGAGVAPPDIGIAEIAVPDLARRAGEIAARFYGEPSTQMFCAGVTGTDGKTSTAYLVAQAFEALGTPCAYLGTIGSGRVGALDPSTHTTPDPVSLQQWLAQMRAQGVRACVMEVSSHALDQARIAGVCLRTAVLTNITRDHLDYHGTVDAYAAAKRKLFERDELLAVVLNRDDAYGAAWARELAAQREVIVYGIDGPAPDGAHLIARELRLSPDGIGFTIDSHLGRAQLRSPLLGRFNVHNLLAALGVLISHQVPLADAVAALAAARTVPGRMEAFRKAGAPLVVVDYAHTPDALRAVLGAARAHTAGRLTAVFGCGGDRDRGKRPLMGAAAFELADRTIVTDDNPRSETPAAIVAEILGGLGLVVPQSQPRVLHDRAEAIRTAIAEAGADDVIVIAGKGHEDYQIYGSRMRHFSDREEVAGVLGLPASQRELH